MPTAHRGQHAPRRKKTYGLTNSGVVAEWGSLGFDEELIAAALGWVCHLVLLTANNYSVPLPYAMIPMASRSLIRDDGATGIAAEYVVPFMGGPGARGSAHRVRGGAAPALHHAGSPCSPKGWNASSSTMRSTSSTRTLSR